MSRGDFNVDDDSRGGMLRTRRDVLVATAGAAGVAGLAGCSGGGGGTTTANTPEEGPANVPVTGDQVTIGVAAPETGVYSGEGEDLKAGYQLAVRNLNNSTGLVATNHMALDGGGINGKSVNLVIQNTDSDGETATEVTRNLVTQNDAVMVTGGASPEEAHSIMDLAGQLEFMHMLGFVPGNTVTGERCSRYAFQGMFNAKMAAQALAPVLKSEFGTGKNMVQVQPDSDLGDSFAESMNEEMKKEASWHQLNTIQTRVGTQSYESALQEAASLGPDVLVLNYYGLDGANALSQAQGIVPEDMGVVVPLYDRALAASAGGSIEGVIGTVNWEKNISEPVSRAFNQAWMEASMGDQTATPTPSGVVHLAYFQLLQYAAAVERADSFHPDDVISQLEDHQYAVGMGTQTFRACDHQSIRPVPVVKGLSKESQYPGTYFERLGITREIGYKCAQPPASKCKMN